ncbi:11161_t:CDS:2, partial [Funneliformis mosseae]
MAHEEYARAIRLEQYRNRQEAAKGFDDDFEFCPSLSAEELAEIRRQGKPVTPPQSKRPIPIIDPSNKTPLNITPIKSVISSATSIGQVSMSSAYYSRPGSPYSHGSNYSPKVTKSIPIIDPSSGNI